MSASTGDLQPLVDELLVLLGVRINAGQLVINIKDGCVMGAETKTYHQAKKSLDSTERFSAR